MTNWTRRDFAAAAAALAWPLRATQPKKVLVAGAGLAGLAAGYELMQSGHEVTVLEARDRPGGRVFTLRDSFREGLYAEAGAEIFGDSHALVQGYVRQFDLPVMPAPGSSRLAQLFYMHGRRVVAGRPGFEWPVQLPAAEQKLGWYDLMRKYIQPGVAEIGNPLSPGWPSPEILAKYDRVSTVEMLRRRGASEEAIEILRLGYSDSWDNGTGPDSALCLLRDHAIARNARAFQRVAGGNDRLPKAFAAKLGQRIRYRTAVTRIEQDARHVRVAVNQDGRRQKLSADCLVCTIPFPVLQSIETHPAFSETKQRAIRELNYLSVTRVFVETRARFWTAGGLSGYAATDLPIGTVWDCSEGEPGNRGILECYASGEAGRRLAALSEPKRVETAVDNLEKLFPGARENREAVVSVTWGDPLTRGAFAWFKAGQMSTLLPHIAAPEGRVFFAGEHTSPWFGWMEGALESGVRAAGEVNRMGA